MTTATTITSVIKVSIVNELANYHAHGTWAIDEAYDIYCNAWGQLSYDEFHDKIDIREIDQIWFMYDVETETWSSDEEMIKYYDRVFGS